MSLLCLALTYTYVTIVDNLWQKCYLVSEKSKGALYSHLT